MQVIEQKLTVCIKCTCCK